MPFRLRLYSGDHLLVATAHETTEEAGRQAAEFPLDDLIESRPDGSAQASVRREVVYLDATGQERAATAEEEQEVFEAMAARAAEISYESLPPCPRCGRKSAEQERPYPVRATLEGPVCFGCWTPEERADLPPGFEM